jgi:DNA replication initiation complex subunit (GINS family)
MVKYEDIRRHQRMERNTPNLASVDGEFYTELAEFVQECRGEYSTSSSSEDLRNLENTLKIARDVFERREQKLLMKSLQCVRTGEPADGVLPKRECELLDALMKILRENRQEFERALQGRTEPAKQVQHINDIPKINSESTETREDLNNVLVRILKKIPKFVSADLKEYGPYDSNEIVKLPLREVELLSSKNFIEVI